MGERYVRRSGIYTTNEGENGAHVKEGKRIPEPIFCGQLEAVPAARYRGAHQGFVCSWASLGVGSRPRGIHHHGDVADSDSGTQSVDILIGDASS